MVEQAAKLANDLGSKNVSALGFGIPGLVNRQTDVVMISPDLPSTVREGLHADLTKATGLRVEIENDANAAAYGEFKVGAGRGSRDIFYMMIGNGIVARSFSMASCGRDLPVSREKLDTSR
jgi:glucokinase